LVVEVVVEAMLAVTVTVLVVMVALVVVEVETQHLVHLAEELELQDKVKMVVLEQTVMVVRVVEEEIM
jgi:uncharacterized membrane protein YcjF (UPF0283 family)